MGTRIPYFGARRRARARSRRDGHGDQSKAYRDKTEVVAQYEEGTPWGMVMPLESPNVGQVNKAVTDMTDDGSFDRLSKDYLEPLFGVGPNSIPFWTVK